MEKNAGAHIRAYLKSHSIQFVEDIWDGSPRITISLNGYSNCPDHRVEACIFFYPAGTLEARVYYAKPAPRIVQEEADRLPDLYRLLNFINAQVFKPNSDRIGGQLYSPSYLVQPRWYVTEDGYYDITATMVLHQDFFWLAPLEFEDYITATLPGLLDQLSPYIFGVLLKNTSADFAIRCIRQSILKESTD